LCVVAAATDDEKKYIGQCELAGMGTQHIMIAEASETAFYFI
jgi:hypothetical protein